MKKTEKVKAAPKIKQYDKRISASDIDLNQFVMDRTRTSTARAVCANPDKGPPRVIQSVATTARN